MRILTLVALVATLALIGAACAPDEEEAEEAPEPDEVEAADEDVEIDIWFGRDDFQPDDAFESFHEEHDNITVNTDTIPLEQAPADFLRQFEAGRGPDILQIEFDQIGVLSERGMLLDIGPILETWEEENPDLYEAMDGIAWDMASWDGTPHGMALHHGPFWYTYSPSLFEEAGVDEVPETWDEVLEAGRQVRENTDALGYTLRGSRDEYPVWAVGVFGQMGGEWEDDVMQLDSEVGHDWIEFYQTLMADEIAHPDTVAWDSGDFRANFIAGDGAQGTIGLNIYPSVAEELEWPDEWDYSPQPIVREGSEDSARYLSGGWPYYVSANTEHPYEVGQVLQYLADFDQALSVAVRYQPVSNMDVMGSDEYLEAAPYAEPLIDAWAEVEPRPAHVNQIAMNEVILDAMQAALQNPDADPADIAAEHQAELDELAEEVPDEPPED